MNLSHNFLRITHYLLLLSIIILIPSAVVHAQDPTPSDDDVNAIAKQLYCPVCENTPLDVCPTEACRQWRNLIRQMLVEGRTEDEIKQYFVEHYGARVLSEPPRTGLNWFIYIVPPAVILAGAFFLFRTLKEWTKPVTASTGSVFVPSEVESTPKDDYVARLEEVLKKRK